MLLGAGRATHYPGVIDESVETPAQRVMHLAVVVAAPREKLWRAMTDAVELRRWNAPVSFVDLRPGGVMEVSYDRNARRGDPNNIKNEIVTLDPGRTLTFRNVQAPAGLPGRERFGHVVTTVAFRDAGRGATRVELWQVGYEGGEADRPLYAFFHSGNAFVLAEMAHVYGGAPKPAPPEGH